MTIGGIPPEVRTRTRPAGHSARVYVTHEGSPKIFFVYYVGGSGALGEHLFPPNVPDQESSSSLAYPSLKDARPPHFLPQARDDTRTPWKVNLRRHDAFYSRSVISRDSMIPRDLLKI